MATSHYIRNPTAKLAMCRAWYVAREQWKLHGGNLHGHFYAALAPAWADIKTDPVVQAVEEICADARAKRKARGNAPDPMARYHRARYAGAAGR